MPKLLNSIKLQRKAKPRTTLLLQTVLKEAQTANRAFKANRETMMPAWLVKRRKEARCNLTLSNWSVRKTNSDKEGIFR